MSCTLDFGRNLTLRSRGAENAIRPVFSEPLRLCVSILFGLGAVSNGLSVSAQDKDKADIPIKRVVMFSSGVAFFEHRGDVEGNSTVEMKFDVKDINDLLKSMVLQDEGGGRV